MIDSHCHLVAPQFDDDRGAVIDRAFAAGVTSMICIGDTIKESKDGLLLAEKYDHIFCTVGVHPHESGKWSLDTLASERATRDDNLVAQLRRLVASSKKVKAIGEIGLDYHYDFSPRDVQRSAFREQLALAKELKMPAVVHCREAVEDIWSIVDDIKPPNLVIHCCTEKWGDVKRFVDKGYLLSFTGIATYPKSDDIRNTIRQCPFDQLMVETDAPFLAPVPHRGKRNEPGFVIEVAKCVAEIKGVSLEEVDQVTTENAVRFFEL